MMDSQTRQQIQQDFALLADDSAASADCFYQRLFLINPKLKVLFSGDLARQGEKLMSTLGLVVQGLDRFDSLKPVLHRLGADHVDYGVEPEHYDQVAQALLWMLEQRLGGRFDDRSRKSWSRLYGLLASEMQAGCR